MFTNLLLDLSALGSFDGDGNCLEFASRSSKDFSRRRLHSLQSHPLCFVDHRLVYTVAARLRLGPSGDINGIEVEMVTPTMSLKESASLPTCLRR